MEAHGPGGVSVLNRAQAPARPDDTLPEVHDSCNGEGTRYDAPFCRGDMGFSLVPRNEQFFKDFVQLSEEIRKGARTLKQMLATDPPDMPKADAIKETEHACDGLTRSIIDRLNRSFITPLDREDIHTLAISLDDIM